MRFVGFLALTLGIGTLAAAPEDAAVKVTHTAHGLIDCGSGTVVKSAGGSSYVLTNAHVAPDPGEAVAIELNGKRYPATWLRADAGIDLALLRVDTTLPTVEVASSEPAASTLLRQWGHPRGGPRTAKSGPALGIDGRRGVPGGGDVFRVGIEAESGDSGCGLIDPDGHLVAVCWGGSGTPRECCVRLSDIRAFLGRE